MEQRRLASTEWVDIVNEENEVIAQASREQMRAQCLRHRATYIVVHDGMGKILVQRRSDRRSVDGLPLKMLRAAIAALFSFCRFSLYGFIFGIALHPQR